MSVKVEHRQESFQGTTVYVVNPEQLRQKVVLQRLKIRKEKTEKSIDASPAPEVKHGAVYDRKPRKRRLESDEGVFEDEDDVAFTKLCTKEVTTRAGRVSKVRHAGSAAKAAKPTSVEVLNGKAKKREPASVFRCPTCQKVYIGYSKLKLHFRKFPTHYQYNNNPETVPNQDTQGKSVSSEGLHAETQTDMRPSRELELSDASVQTVQMEGPTRFGEFIARNSNASFPNFSSSALESSAGVIAASKSFVAHSQTDFARSFTSLAPPQKHINGDFVTPSSNAPVTCFSIFPVPKSPTTTNSNSQQPNHVSRNETVVPISPTIGRIANGPASSGSDGGQSLAGMGMFQKLLWDLVEEKMIQHGINEILTELADVAEKLSKIARDKIIPIREEEEEQLRVNNTAPIVQVDTPFLSHLLDLPFGTYMFKEDAGVRRAPPPPVPADISLNSLTSGVEVDIDKFLPGIDLIHLPHLTNLDFSSI